MYVKELNVNVVEAAERRIYKLFQDNKLVSLSLSGGKDSICLADVMVKTMQKYGISFDRLIVVFFDEEAIYPDVEQIVLEWRSKFLSLGAKFYWFCLPIKHFNCCNQLANDETFICWEPGKEDVWVRPMPKFAIRNHKQFKMGMNYQTFGQKVFKNIPQAVGLRVAESAQRRSSISSMRNSKFAYPIYDWKDEDIWLYIQHNRLRFPDTYIYLYKTGVPRHRLRISQFFSIDTIKSLPKVLEFYPNLYEKVLAREPNVDLVMLYWDTDMFRSSKQDRDFKVEKAKPYSTLFCEEMAKAARNPSSYPGYEEAKRLYSNVSSSTSEKTYQKIYQILIAGDPKRRSYRVVKADMIRDMQRSKPN